MPLRRLPQTLNLSAGGLGAIGGSSCLPRGCSLRNRTAAEKSPNLSARRRLLPELLGAAGRSGLPHGIQARNADPETRKKGRTRDGSVLLSRHSAGCPAGRVHDRSTLPTHDAPRSAIRPVSSGAADCDCEWPQYLSSGHLSPVAARREVVMGLIPFCPA